MIYVGKAINLRQRLNSYFADPSALHFRTQTMVRTAAKVEWTLVRNELEALQLEYTWIKQFDPRFNIKYRDDKSYPWVAISWGEEFPRVYVGRGAKRRSHRYFGPYAQAWAIRETLDSLLRVFPMRSCSNGVFNSAKASGRPCLLGYIGKCAAPCVGRIDPGPHRELVNGVCEFLAGRTTGLVAGLQAEMQQAAQNEEFERAAVLRDRLVALQQASERNAIVLSDGTNADLVALATDPLEVAIQVFHIRNGRILGERSWVAERLDDSDSAALLEKCLVQLYAEDSTDVPPRVLVPELPPAAEVVEQLLGEERGTRVRLVVPKRGDKAALMQTAVRNAEQALALHKLRRSSDLSSRGRALAELQEALGLDQAPLRIECYDISHTQGSEVVASMVVFEDGKPAKKEYRRFNIKTVVGANDFASMKEIVGRRFRRAAEMDEEEQGKWTTLPDLVIIDGGKGQLGAAMEALEETGMSVPICGLAKENEEIFLPGRPDSILLPRDSQALFLVQRVRDEAHRFAITFHRAKRSKAAFKSGLDDVPGVGPVRKKALIRHFGSVKAIREASIDELTSVDGVNRQVAEQIKATLGSA